MLQSHVAVLLRLLQLLLLCDGKVDVCYRVMYAAECDVCSLEWCVLQCDTVGCRAIECLAPSFSVCCSVVAASLQCCCSDVAVFCKVILWDAGNRIRSFVFQCVLQCCCSVVAVLLQRCCSVLQCDAVGCRAIECLAPSFGVCCSVDAASLQCCCSDVAVF